MKKKKNGLFLRATAVSALFAAVLTACSLFNFDASAYTKSCLDASLKGDFSEYTKLTRISENKAKENRQADIYNDLTLIFSGVNLSDEMKQKYCVLLSDIYSKCQYEVGEAVKNGSDSYTVPVTAKRMVVFSNSPETAEKKTIESYKGSGKNPSKDQVMKKYGEILYDILSQNIQNPTYEEPQTIQITVEKADGEKSFGISTDQMTKLYQALMDMDSLFETGN